MTNYGQVTPITFQPVLQIFCETAVPVFTLYLVFIAGGPKTKWKSRKGYAGPPLLYIKGRKKITPGFFSHKIFHQRRRELCTEVLSR